MAEMAGCLQAEEVRAHAVAQRLESQVAESKGLGQLEELIVQELHRLSLPDLRIAIGSRTSKQDLRREWK